jgi:hypothetical protein
MINHYQLTSFIRARDNGPRMFAFLGDVRLVTRIFGGSAARGRAP